MKKKMKIYYLFNSKYERVPLIKISNQMMRKFGFEIGDEIEITYSDDKIVIEKRALDHNPKPVATT